MALFGGRSKAERSAAKSRAREAWARKHGKPWSKSAAGQAARMGLVRKANPGGRRDSRGRFCRG